MPRKHRNWRQAKTGEDFFGDRQFQLALVRLPEIVGEAANRVPREEQERLAGIAWPEIIALRNRLIHGYDSVDLGILWRVIQQNLPDLVAQLEEVLDAR